MSMHCRETWIVMDLMDRGTLASAVRRGMFANQADNKIKAVSSIFAASKGTACRGAAGHSHSVPPAPNACDA
jgi:hypothetical protein